MFAAAWQAEKPHDAANTWACSRANEVDAIVPVGAASPRQAVRPKIAVTTLTAARAGTAIRRIRILDRDAGPHHADERIEIERLGDESHAPVVHHAQHLRVAHETRHEHDWQGGAQGEQLFRELAAAHLRHHHVGEKHGEVVGRSLERGQRLDAVGRGDHCEAGPFQEDPDGPPHRLLVLGDEHQA